MSNHRSGEKAPSCETCPLALRRRAWGTGAFGLALVLGLLFQGSVAAQAQVFPVVVSPDVTIGLASEIVEDQEVVSDDLGGLVTPLPPTGLPASAAIDAYHGLVDGQALLSFDTTVALPGAVTAEPADVVHFDGVGYAVFFDGSAASVPAGANVDAVTVDDVTGALLLSFDVATILDGLLVDDADVVAFDGSSFSIALDADAAGIPRRLDVDALAWLTDTGDLAISFDTSGTIDGIVFDDEDVLTYDEDADVWAMAWDASASHSAWTDADLDAVHFVPEPGFAVMFAAGLALLAAAHWRRRSREERDMWNQSVARTALLMLLLSASTGVARADDGAIEISQALALAGGVTPGDAPDFPVTIDTPGSYLLTSNLTVSDPSTNAIEITADDVQLDLNGFGLHGPGSGTGDGINASTASSTSVFNGFVTGFENGVLVDDNCHVSGVISWGNSAHGIFADWGCTLTRNITRSNGNDGIDTDQGAVVTGNVSSNNGARGIRGRGTGSTMRHNVAYQNGSDGFSCFHGCVVEGNVAALNGAAGIKSFTGSMINGNVVYDNATYQFDLDAGTGYTNNVMYDSDGINGVLGPATAVPPNICNGGPPTCES